MKAGGFPLLRRVPLLGSTLALVWVAALPDAGAASASHAQAPSHARTSKSSQIAQVRAIVRGLGVQPPRKVLGKGKVREPLFSLYLVRTRVAEKASLGFSDGTVLQINQRTDAVLSSSSATKVKNGEVDQIMQPGTKHQVKTATATASAIGTNWDTKCRKQSCNFTVAEGAVKVSARVRVNGKIKIFSVIVKTGQQTAVRNGKRPTKPKAVNVKKVLGWTTSLPSPPVTLGQNIALDANGGVVTGVTSTRVDTNVTWDVHHVIDGKLTSGWQSGPGQISNQIITLSFAGSSVFHIYGIVIDPAATGKEPASDDLKAFTVQVSQHGSAYTTVFTGQTSERAALQRFTFSGSHDADHVQVILQSNWGGPDGIAVSEIEVVGASDKGPVGSPLPTPTPTVSGSKLGLTGAWTYFADTKTIAFEFAPSPTSSAAADRRFSSLYSRSSEWATNIKQEAVSLITLKSVPVAGGVVFQGFGLPVFNFSVSHADLNAAPRSGLTTPNTGEFGFMGTGVPAATIQPSKVYDAVFKTSQGNFTVKVYPAVRQGETSFLQNMLATVYSPGAGGPGKSAPTSIILPIAVDSSLSGAGVTVDGLPINTTGASSTGNYVLKFPQGVPTYDGFAVYGVSRPAISLPFMLFLGANSKTNQLPVITRPATAFHEIYGNRLVIADTYSPVATPPFCSPVLPTSGDQPKFDTISFSGSSIIVSPATGGTLAGIVSLDGIAHATGTINGYSISWDARLAPDGTGIGTEQLMSGGCDVSVPFEIRPAALDPPGPGSSGLTVAPAKITLRTKVGSTTSPTPVTAKNPGSRPVIVLAVHLAGDIKAFKLGDGTCARGITVPAGQSCDLAVSFDAYRSGSIHGTIAIDYMSGGKVKAGAVSLTGAQTSTPGNSVKAATATLLKQINIDRAKDHLSPYVLDPTVSICATAHSKYMAQIGNLTHVGFPADICVPHKHQAENVGEDPSQPVSVAVLKMESSFVSEGPCAHNPCTPGDLVNHSHWVFLMSRVFTHVGIGLYVHGRETWLTEDFFTP